MHIKKTYLFVVCEDLSEPSDSTLDQFETFSNKELAVDFPKIFTN